MLISPYMMHRHEDYFLEPSEFLPDRFEKGGSIDVPSYMYMPLGIEHQAERGMDYITEIVTIFLLSEMTKRFLFQLTKPRIYCSDGGRNAEYERRTECECSQSSHAVLNEWEYFPSLYQAVNLLTHPALRFIIG